jgi:hypothetical protein
VSKSATADLDAAHRQLCQKRPLNATAEKPRRFKEFAVPEMIEIFR